MSDCAFDPLAVAVDWLDACRARNLAELLNLYDKNATHFCGCEGKDFGSENLAQYWSGRLARAVPEAFHLIDLAWKSEGHVHVRLEHVAFDGAPICIDFRFTTDGKIEQTSCGPIRHCLKSA